MGLRDSSIARADPLRQRLSMPFPPTQDQAAGQSSGSTEATVDPADPADVPPTTLGHVLTNVVILYEFLLELSAVVQARGSLFEEAGYD